MRLTVSSLAVLLSLFVSVRSAPQRSGYYNRYSTTTSSYRGYGRYYDYTTTPYYQSYNRYPPTTTQSPYYNRGYDPYTSPRSYGYDYQPDRDDDNDGIPDEEDYGLTNLFNEDYDSDGIPDTIDNDDDNDGIPDSEDRDDGDDGIPDEREYDYYRYHKSDRYDSDPYYSSTPYTPIDPLGFLPTSVRDWLETSFKKVGDVVSEIAASKEKVISEFVDNTLRQGNKVLDQLSDDVMNKTETNRRDLINTIADFENKIIGNGNKFLNIFYNEEPLNKTDLDQNKEDLEDIKMKLKEFESKVEEEIEKEQNLPFALRNQLLKFITTSRAMVKGMGTEEEKFWNRLKLMEKEIYQFQLSFAETSDDLKTKMDSLFDSLKKVDIPQLKSVQDGEEILDQFDTFINKLLTE